MNRKQPMLMVFLSMAIAASAAVKTNTTPTNATGDLKPVDTMRLSPHDVLAYSIEDDPVKGPDMEKVVVNAMGNCSFRISRGSDITIPVKVTGKTIEDIQAEIKKKLDADFYVNCKVKLELMDRAPRYGQILFIGPGTRGNTLQIAHGEEKRIFEAVYQAGVTEWANLKNVKLSRVNPQTQKTEIKVVDLEEIRKGNRANNVTLMPGDIIEVPEKTFNFLK